MATRGGYSGAVSSQTLPSPLLIPPVSSSSFITGHLSQQAPPAAGSQNTGMYNAAPNSQNVPVPYRPTEPTTSYFPPQQLRPHSADVRGASCLLPNPTQPQDPPSGNQAEQSNAMTRPLLPTPVRNIGPRVFLPSRRSSVEAVSTSRGDTSFGVKRGRGFSPAAGAQTAGSWRPFRGNQRNAALASESSGFGDTAMDEGWKKTSSGGGATTQQGFGSPASTGNQTHPPWLSYSQNRKSPAVQKDRVRSLMEVEAQPSRTFSSKCNTSLLLCKC